MRYILPVSKTSALVKETLFLTKNYDIRAEDIGYGPYSGLVLMDRSDIVIYRNSLNKFRTAEKSTMKNRSVQYLRNCCENALRELYPAGIPRRYPNGLNGKLIVCHKSRTALIVFSYSRNSAMLSNEPAAGNLLYFEVWHRGQHRTR